MSKRRGSLSLPILSKFAISLVLLILLIVGLWFNAVSGRDQVLAPEQSAYAITGNFAIGGNPQLKRRDIKAMQRRAPDINLWSSWTGDVKHTGKLVSPTFQAPPILSLFVTGFPDYADNQLYLERTDTHEIMSLKVFFLGDRLRELSWFLPPNWYNKPVQLVAIDQLQDALGWLGVSTPLQTNFLSLIRRQFAALILIPIYLSQFVLFLLPGLCLAGWSMRSLKLHPAFTVMLAITFSALIGYITFWGYFLHHQVGQAFGVCIALTSIGYAFSHLYKKTLPKLFLTVDVVAPILLMLLVGLGYVAFLYTVSMGEEPELTAQIRFFEIPFPPDNILPKLFADRLYAGVDPRPLLQDWLSSDRPPLQTGIVLFQAPFWQLTKLGNGLHYQIVGTIAQSAWIAAIWALCRIINLSGWRIALVMIFAAFSGFFLVNSVYTWPKLLPAALIVLAFTLLAQAIYESRRVSNSEILLAATATALGLLTHGGAVFTLPAIALMLFKPNRVVNLRQIAIGCLILVGLIAPWTAYQKFYEPPANRLVKWHLANVIQIDSRSSWQAIVDSYSSTSLAQIISNKWENVTTLFDSMLTSTPSSDFWRAKEYFHCFWGLGILNVGWLILLVLWLSQSSKKDEVKKVGLLLSVGGWATLFWVIVMFGPGATTIHLGSYATFILIFTGLAILVTRLPRWLCYSLLAFHLVAFMIHWIITPPGRLSDVIMVAPNILLAGVAIAATLGLVKVFYWLSQYQFDEYESLDSYA